MPKTVQPDPDLSDFHPGERKRAYTQCKLARALESLSTDDTRKVQKAFAEPVIGHRAITSWLDERGVRVSYTLVQDHRSSPQRCACRGR